MRFFNKKIAWAEATREMPYERDRERIRIFIEIFCLSEEWAEESSPNRVRRLHSETLLQKMDFLVRNPDYLCLLLLERIENSIDDRNAVKETVQNIFREHEPEIRREEMERFFYGAYEPLDDAIAYLVSLGLIEYVSLRNQIGAASVKDYYITPTAVALMQRDFDEFPSLRWYIERCNLLKQYFGHLNGSQVKRLEYQIEEYSSTKLTQPIREVIDKVREAFEKEYGEPLC